MHLIGKRKYVSIFMSSAVIAGGWLCSCSNYEGITSTDSGFVRVSAEVDNAFITADGSRISGAGEIDDSTLQDVSLTVSTQDGALSHTWSRISEYDATEGLEAGAYVVSAALKTGTAYSLTDTAEVNVSPGATTNVALTLRPDCACVHMAGTAITVDGFTLDKSSVFSLTSGEYATFDASGNAYVYAGKVQPVARVTDASGSSVNVISDKVITMARAHYYNIDVAEMGIRPSASLFAGEAPRLEPDGFVSGQVLTATEGVTMSDDIAVTVTSDVPLRNLLLGVNSPLVKVVGIPSGVSQIDLLHPDANSYGMLEDSGLVITCNADTTSVSVDFSRAIEGMASVTSGRTTFMLTAIDGLGRISDAVQLVVDTHSLSFKVVEVTAASISDDIAHITLSPSLQGVEESDLSFATADATGNTTECPITSFENNGSLIEAGIRLPEGIAPVSVRIYYMGLLRGEVRVDRSIPAFTVEVDEYATTARLKINSASERAAKALTRYAYPIVGQQRVSIQQRDTLHQTIVVNGLTPAKKYAMTMLVPGYSRTAEFAFRTEAALTVPDGDFEDVVPGLITYKQLPCGGRYAISAIDMPNRQNFVDIDVAWSKSVWASVNGRTFCKDAKRHNTWYMQPSSEAVKDARSGARAVLLTSVGWDLDGEPIPDYVPDGKNVAPTNFSLSVPKVAHRSAGRLFLGKYSFDPVKMTEEFVQGTAFTSRPSSLNGFYKFSADNTVYSDCGGMQLQLVNRAPGREDIVVATADYTFTPSPDYKAFNAPITYHTTEIKPTHLLLMFVSSTKADDVAIDDNNVPVTAFPEFGVMRGSMLWIDNLSFTY